MGKIFAVINQKGGVGKTTTVINLGAALNAKGYKVLLVDTDSQCNLSYNAGGEYDNGKTTREMMLGEASASDCIQRLPKFDLIGGSSEMAEIPSVLSGEGKEYRLKNAIDALRGAYDYIIIDSPPALSLVTVNVLTAADAFIITAQADIFSMQGIGQLFSTYEVVKTYCNPGLAIAGILLTKHNDRNNFTKKSVADIREMAGEIGTKVYETAIHDSIRVREATAAQKDIFDYQAKCRPALDYEAFAEEFLKDRQ